VRILLVALGGAAGALARFGVNEAVGPRSWPWATLLVNLTGSFALGAVMYVATDRHWSPELSAAVGIGFLGAYTTFSTFSVEAFDLGRTERVPMAALYVGTSVAVGILAAAGGYTLARVLSR
jgi:fluoride exporter